MEILSGAGALAVTSVLFGWAYGVLRRPNPRRWADSEGIASAVCFVLTALVSLTAGLLIQFALELSAGLPKPDAMTWLLAAGIVAAALVAARALMAPALGKPAGAEAHMTTLAVPVPGAMPDPANENAGVSRDVA